MLFALIFPRAQRASTYDISAERNVCLQSALRSFAIVCDRLRSFAIIWKPAFILRRRAGYELIYITNEAVGQGRVSYYQLISGKSEKNNCLSKFSSNPITGNCGESKAQVTGHRSGQVAGQVAGQVTGQVRSIGRIFFCQGD